MNLLNKQRIVALNHSINYQVWLNAIHSTICGCMICPTKQRIHFPHIHDSCLYYFRFITINNKLQLNALCSIHNPRPHFNPSFAKHCICGKQPNKLKRIAVNPQRMHPRIFHRPAVIEKGFVCQTIGPHFRSVFLIDLLYACAFPTCFGRRRLTSGGSRFYGDKELGLELAPRIRRWKCGAFYCAWKRCFQRSSVL